MNKASNIKVLKQFLTEEHDCSYLPGKQARTLFIDPDSQVEHDTYRLLSEQGYRRSGRHIYKPQCEHCNACISLRIPVKQYVFSHNDKRVLKHNADLEFWIAQEITDKEYYLLYAEYITARHQDGDMYPPSFNQYNNFLNNAFGNTEYFVFRDRQNQLKLVAVVDFFENALSAIYTFFDAKDDKRSLGTFSILWQIQQAQELGLDYVYLGYWVKDCPKMRYKTRFRPAEVYINGRWLSLS